MFVYAPPIVRARFWVNLVFLYMIAATFAVYTLKPGYFIRPKLISPVVSSSAVTEPPISIIGGNPLAIKVPRFVIDLAIEPGLYNPDDGTWSLSDYGAQYATPSAQINDHSGNSLIYGHNNKHVFGPLKALAPGDEAQILTDNGYIFHYKYERSEDVMPDNVVVFSYAGPPMLTIQTCSGNWNEWRRMYWFKFERVEKV